MPSTTRPHHLPIDAVSIAGVLVRLPAPMSETWAMGYLLAVTVTGATGTVLLLCWTDLTPWLCLAVGLALGFLTACTGRTLANAWWRSRPTLEHPVSWLCQRTTYEFDSNVGWLELGTCEGPADMRVQVVCSYCTQIESANWCQDCIDTASQRPRPRCTACGRPIAEVLTPAGAR